MSMGVLGDTEDLEQMTTCGVGGDGTVWLSLDGVVSLFETDCVGSWFSWFSPLKVVKALLAPDDDREAPSTSWIERFRGLDEGEEGKEGVGGKGESDILEPSI